MAAVGLTLACATPAAAFAQSTPLAVSQAATTAGDRGDRQVAADEALTAQIKERLQRNRLFRQADIFVQTHAAVVTLAGSVPSEIAHSEALDLARKTPGVLGVEDQLRVLISSPDAPAPER
jgi:osmotically-inducible protein OsmY